MEYLPLVKALVVGRPFALGTILLTSVYQAMRKYVYDEPFHRVGSTLWFVQMWLFAYFPELLGQDLTFFETLGLHAMCFLCSMPFDDLMEFFLGLADHVKPVKILNFIFFFKKKGGGGGGGGGGEGGKNGNLLE